MATAYDGLLDALAQYVQNSGDQNLSVFLANYVGIEWEQRTGGKLCESCRDVFYQAGQLDKCPLCNKSMCPSCTIPMIDDDYKPAGQMCEQCAVAAVLILR